MMQNRFKVRVWDKEKRQYNNGMLVFDYMRGILDPEKYILEQCTGLEDKNGKLIYEGDIVRNGLHNNLVEWFKGGFWVNGFTNGARWEMHQYHQNLEIIGNVHENPEVLENKR